MLLSQFTYYIIIFETTMHNQKIFIQLKIYINLQLENTYIIIIFRTFDENLIDQQSK